MKLSQKKIKEISNKLDKLLEKAGQFNRYQFTILVLFTFQFILTQFFNTGLFFLSEKPTAIPNSNNNNETFVVNKEICKHIEDYHLEKNYTISSILVEYDIYCDNIKTYFISICLYTGMFIGSFISYIFADRIGRKKSLCIIIPIYILSLVSFELTNQTFFGHEFKAALYFLYFIIFFEGLTSRIVNILLIIYICDIINQKDIPLFINIILSGSPISEFLSSLIFTFVDINWRHILAIQGLLNIFLFIAFLFLLIASPIFCLNNEDYDNFIKNLMKIGKFNKKSLHIDDFSFLKPYMSSKQKVNIEKEDIDIGDNKEKNLLYDDVYLSGSESLSIKEDLFFKTKDDLKNDFLIQANENKNKPYINLFGNLKMKDYSPLDLFKEEQIRNFLILSYLWLTSTLMREGFNIYFINLKEYKDNFKYYIFFVFGEFIGFIFIYLTFTRKITPFHPLLVSLLLINFLILAFGIYPTKEFNFSDFVQLFSIKVITGSIRLILYIMTLLIYPAIIRTHGLGGSLTLANIGNIVAIFFNYDININEIALYYLVFLFFALMLSYGLPNKIGSIVLAKPMEEKKPDDEENIDIPKKFTGDIILEDEKENEDEDDNDEIDINIDLELDNLKNNKNHKT